MPELLISIWIVAAVFFVVALVYSSVGLGGGSSYTALLVIFGFSTLSIPLISLSLNILVTTIGSYQFIRHRHVRLRLIAPFILSSIPMAYLGGTLQIPRQGFQWILLVSLIVVIYRIYFLKTTAFHLQISDSGKLIISLIAGAILGLVAGIVGIGGGVYLVPLILVLGLGTVKEAAACGAVFVWLNSVAGLSSRLQFNSVDFLPYAPLAIAVILGGGLGSYLGSSHYSAQKVEKILGIIVLIAAVFLVRALLFTV